MTYYREPTQDERKLASIAIELALTAAERMSGKSPKEVAEWAAGQLNACGFIGAPVGMEWHYLTKVKTS